MSEETSIIGQIVKGQITNIVKFGAFIKLENGEVGLVHISEVSYEFISNLEFISDSGFIPNFEFPQISNLS